MGRPSKLTPDEWAEIERRVTAGERVRALAEEFGISPAQISKRFPNKGNKAVVEVAEQLAEAHTALAALPVHQQGTAWSMSLELRELSVDMLGSARLGAKNSLRLNALANSELQKIDDADPLASADALKGVAVLTKMANEAAHIPVNLLAANKDRIQKLDDQPDPNAAPTSGVLMVPGLMTDPSAWSQAAQGQTKGGE